MCAMKKIQRLLLAAVIAVVASGCTSAYFSSVSAYDDLYATHDVKAIAERQKAEAEVRKAEAEALKAEAEARAAQLKAENLENQNKIEALTAALNASLQSNNSTVHVKVTDDGLLITDNDAPTLDNSYVADSYESAYARRLKGFSSPTYRMPSSYFNLRYNPTASVVTAYDPALYNIMVSGDEVWVEPKYITSMFGTWGAINATISFTSPWYYGWRSWGNFDPWYYRSFRSCWGFPRYSWWDWNWHMCYGDPYYYRWTGSLGWWGWGGMYCPSYYHWGWHYPHYHNHWGGHWGGSHWGHSYYGWGGGWSPAPPRHHAPRLGEGPNPKYDRGGNIYGSRNQNSGQGGSRNNNGSIVNRGSSHSTPYRSPNNGTTYGNGTRGKSATAAIQQQRAAEASRSASVGRGTSRSTGRSSYSSNSSSSSSRSSVSINRSSSSSSSSSYSSGGGSSYSGGSSGGGSRGGGGSSGGGGGAGSRGR